MDDPIKKPFPYNILRNEKRMTWNYRIIKKSSKVVDEDYYYIAEVFYDSSKKPIAQTEAIEITGSSKQDIIDILNAMLEDAETREILEELGNE